MKHAERCQFWKRPDDKDDWQNSLQDAFASMNPGKMLVYRMARPGDGSVERLSAENRAAAHIAAKMNGALVQWPSEPTNGNRNAVRKWLYAIQKPHPNA